MKSLDSFVIGDKNMTFLNTRKDKCVACVFWNMRKYYQAKTKQKIKGQKNLQLNLNAENTVYYNFIGTKKAFSNLPVGWNMSDMNTANKKSGKNWA